MAKKILVTPEIQKMVQAAYDLGVHVGKAQVEQEVSAQGGNGANPQGPRQWRSQYSADEVEVQTQTSQSLVGEPGARRNRPGICKGKGAKWPMEDIV